MSERVNLKIVAGSYYAYEFEGKKNTEYIFNLKVIEGKDVKLLFLDELNYYKYKSKSNNDKYFKSYRVNELGGIFSTDNEGKYYAVVSNTHASWHTKKVEWIFEQNDSMANLMGNNYLYQPDYLNIKIFHSKHQLEYPAMYLMKITDNNCSIEYKSYYKTDLYIYLNDETYVSVGSINNFNKKIKPNIYAIKNYGGSSDHYGTIYIVRSQEDGYIACLKANMHTMQVTFMTMCISSNDYNFTKKEINDNLPSNYQNPVNKYFPSFIISNEKPKWRSELAGAVYVQMINNNKAYKFFGFGENGIIDFVLTSSD